MGNPIEVLEYELQQERAASLGRAGTGLVEAIAALRAFDEGAPPEGVVREQLVAEAAERLWFYVVTRDALGLHHHEAAFRTYDVPAEVMVRMGPRRR